MELIQIANTLVPGGVPNFLSVVNYPKIDDLLKEHGQAKMLKIIFLQVKDFCGSFNVVRNMNEDQMIEAASMLLEERDNFRLEDYTMMFAMAKRGQLFDVHDRIDLQVITTMLDKFWTKRQAAARDVQQQEEMRLNSIGPTTRSRELANPGDVRLEDGFLGIGAAIADMRTLAGEEPIKLQPPVTTPGVAARNDLQQKKKKALQDFEKVHGKNPKKK